MKIITALLLTVAVQTVIGQTALFIPPALTGTTFNLNIQTGTKAFFTGYTTPTYGINGAFLAPTLIVNKGDTVAMLVNNGLPVTTTIHWHGLHVPPECDGGPEQLISPSTTWAPRFKVMNDAGTYWYHPHGAGKTDLHVSKGIAGMIIVKDAVESALNLPRTYGVDDIPVIVQTKAFDVLRQIAIATDEDTTMMVNGTIDPYYDAPAQVVRLRLLNGSSMRSYMFGFSSNIPFKLIASDDGLLDTPVTLTRIRMSPGERYEILLNLTGMVGQTVFFKNYGSELPAGIYGADTLGTDSAIIPGYSNNHLNGADYNIMKINVTSATSGAITTIPPSLAPLTPWSSASVDANRTFNLSPLTPDSSTYAEGPFSINGVQFNMDSVNVITHLNSTEIWKLVNHTMIAHPFHIHDMHFYVLDINGVPPPAYERGKKDVVLVMPGDSVRFITRFEDFANDTVPYMYHCHLLHHEDDGMMGQFIVSSSPEKVEKVENYVDLKLYPNPVTELLNIDLIGTSAGSPIAFAVYDLFGRKMHSDYLIKKASIDVSCWAKGIYFISLVENSNVIKSVFIIQ